MTKNVAYSVAEIETTVDMMTTLFDMYEKLSVINKVFLMKKLFNLTMREDTSAVTHISSEINNIVCQLTSIEINFYVEVCALSLRYLY